jgi:hypothetical protein
VLLERWRVHDGRLANAFRAGLAGLPFAALAALTSAPRSASGDEPNRTIEIETDGQDWVRQGSRSRWGRQSVRVSVLTTSRLPIFSTRIGRSGRCVPLCVPHFRRFHVIVRETHRALEPGSSRCAYRSTILSDGQAPIICTARSDMLPFATITVATGLLARTRLRTAVRRRSCGTPPGSPPPCTPSFTLFQTAASLVASFLATL